jgi:hypothetical protein
MTTTPLMRTGLACALLALLGTAAAPGQDNSFLPDSGSWSSNGNWSLGHRPTTNEHARIEATGPVKTVDYDYGGLDGLSAITIDGFGSAYAAIWQLAWALDTTFMYIGDDGEAIHWMESSAHLWVDDTLYVGYTDTGPGHFYLATAEPGVGSGLYVGDYCYVGYHCPGDFDHAGGEHQCDHLYVGQNAPGEYLLRDAVAGSELTVVTRAVIGNADVGTFEQTGGTFNHTSGNSLMLGLNTGGVGTYLMKGGVLNVGYISTAFNGDGYFTQSGGTVNVTGNITLGSSGTSPNQSWYKLNESDGDAHLNVGGDLNVGPFTSAKYEQTAGTAVIEGDLEINGGGDSSYVYLGASAGLLDVNGSVINQAGYYDQDGGVMTTSHFTNNSSQGFNLDYNADFRATNVEHNAGAFYMWRNALVRGEEAIPGVFFLCNFTNNAHFQMGNTSYDGGTFIGHVINNGWFNYAQGDFSQSILTNNDTLNLIAPFTCLRLVQNAYSYTVTSEAPITAVGTGYASAFESNGILTIEPDATIRVIDAPLVSNEAMYAGGTVIGDLVNNDFLLPAVGGTTDEFYIDGDFTQSGTGFLRIRIGGTTPITQFDRLRVTGHANLGGTLQVLLADGFVPSVGNSFRVVIYNGGHTGQFSPLNLPALPADREWQVSYLAGMLQLDVVEPQLENPGDLNCDGDVNFDDIDPFVLALSGEAAYNAQYPDCNWMNADCNQDGSVDFDDIDAFVGLLSGS